MTDADGQSRSIATEQAYRQASTLHDDGKFAEAEALLRAAIARDPGSGKLINALGVMLAAQGRHWEAVRRYREALALDPEATGPWTNLGNSLTQLGQLASALHCHRRAIALSRGEIAVFHHNLGKTLAEAGEDGEAIAAFTTALKLDPAYDLARLNRGICYLSLGNYAQGWPDYEARKTSGQLRPRQLAGAEWQGHPYHGKRLLIVAEQGLGDMIWVAHYFPLVKSLGGELMIECKPELIALVESMGVADRVITQGQPAPAADLHCYLCSLPGLFAAKQSLISGRPYLTAPADRIDKFKTLIPQGARRLKVGLVWSGSLQFSGNARRARSLIEFFHACALPGIQLYSLQKGEPERELAELPDSSDIVDLGPHLHDFADTAAAVSQLDLIVMTDTAVAHLAGALGKPVWVLLGMKPHWLWLRDRIDSPWYDSMRLYRPRVDGDWTHVFDRVSVDLMSLLKF